MAVALGALEGLLPRPVPFLKLGLANVAVVFALVRDGAESAVTVGLVRVVAVALVSGTLATPTFALSVGGAALSLAAMALLLRLFPAAVSVVGLSVAGGEASISGQLLAAGFLLPGLPLGDLAAPALAWGCVSGAIVGVAANWLLRRGRLSKALDHLAHGAGGG